MLARPRAAFVALLSLAACTEGAPAAAPRPPNPAPAPATERAPTPAPQGPKVAFVGDSITAGLHLPAEQAFPALLQDRLREKGVPFQLINAGVSGDTSAGGLRRIDWILKQRPAVVVIELGGNDGLRGVPLPDIERNLRGMIEKTKTAGARPLLLGMRLPPSYGADYASSFDGIYPRLARELDVPLLPYFMQGVAGVPALNLEDGLHPSAEGHRRLADNLEIALLALLQPGG